MTKRKEFTMSEKKTYKFDIVTEDITLEKSIENLHERIPSAVVTVKSLREPSLGWPVIEVEILDEQSEELKAWYFDGVPDADSYDINDFIVTN